MFKDNLIILQMIELADKIIMYTKDFDSAETFVSDSKSYDATLMNFISLGESVNKLSSDFKLKNEQIDWRKISAFRNIIAHDYFGTDEEEVWQIILNHIPFLKQELTRIIETS